MADDTTLNPGVGGDIIATDDNGSGVKFQVVKLALDNGDLIPPTEVGSSTRSTAMPVAGVGGQPVATQDQNNGTDSAQYTVLVGDPNSDWAGVNLLEALMDESQRFGVGTRVLNPVATDVNNATISSDAPVMIKYSVFGAVSGPIIDTTGYESVVIQQTAGGASIPQTSNDGVAWSTIFGANQGTVIPTSTLGNGMYVFPVIGRWFRIVGVAAVQMTATIYLRQAPFNFVGTAGSLLTTVNLTQINGTAPVSTGVLGMLSVGGNVAAGVAPTADPVLVAGVDNSVTNTGVAAPLTRRLLTDTAGRLFVEITGVGLDAVVRALTVKPAQDGQSNALAVDVVTQNDAQTIPDLLQLMLFEQRITNQYLFSLSKNIITGVPEGAAPEDFRQSPNLFDLN